MEGKIYQAISSVMADIGAVGKNDYNQIQKFKFRGIDAVMNALYPALVKNHVFVVPEILEQTREERESKQGAHLIYSICKIRYTFYADDGSSISAVTIGEGMDSGDKATNKAMAIALKYAFFQVFCIPTEEMTDPDADSPEVAPAKKEPKYITEKEKIVLTNLCHEINLPPERVFSAWPNITSEQYVQACNMLKDEINKRSKK